jgi:hypothetical protein
MSKSMGSWWDWCHNKIKCSNSSGCGRCMYAGQAITWCTKEIRDVLKAAENIACYQITAQTGFHLDSLLRCSCLAVLVLLGVLRSWVLFRKNLHWLSRCIHIHLHEYVTQNIKVWNDRALLQRHLHEKMPKEDKEFIAPRMLKATSWPLYMEIWL